MKRNGPEEQSLGLNFSNLLYALVSSDGDDGRVKATELETNMQLLSGTDKGSSLDRYRHTKQRPSAENAWLIGEALFKSGVEWMNGLIALYAAGRLEDFVPTIASFLHPGNGGEVPSPDICALLRRLLLRLDLLVLLFPFELEPDIARPYGEIDDGKHALFLVRPLIQQIATSPDEAQDLEQLFIRREAAKRDWLKYLPLCQAFNHAFHSRKFVLKNKRTPAVFHGLNVIAKASELEWSVKKSAISTILGSWLDALTFEDDDDLVQVEKQ